MSNTSTTTFVFVLLQLFLNCCTLIVAQDDCTVELNAVKGDLDNVNVSLSAFKKAIIAVPIIAFFLILIVTIVLVLLVKKLAGIKKRMPAPVKDMSLISFLRGLDSSITGGNINVETGVNIDKVVVNKGNVTSKQAIEINGNEFLKIGHINRDFSQPILGRGIFHIAFKGQMNGQLVVVKQFSNPIEQEDLIAEEIVKEHQLRKKIIDLGKNFIVDVKGTIFDHPSYGFVSKYYPKGSLYSLLVERREAISEQQILKYALQVAEAVKLLHDNGILHKGIAARNVLLEDDLSSVRLDLYFEPSNSAVVYGKQHRYVGPVAWLAPETIETKVHTKASDVFSYGVFLWELVAKMDPYSDRNVITVACPVIHKGLRLTIPEKSPMVLAKLMTTCFDESPQNRPTFEAIIADLKNSS